MKNNLVDKGAYSVSRLLWPRNGALFSVCQMWLAGDRELFRGLSEEEGNLCVFIAYVQAQ